MNPKEIDESENGIVWNSQHYRAVVFCEGAAVEQNLFFETPLLRPAKGEILVIEAAGVPQEVFNGKVYGVPLGNCQFKVGATYEWDAPHAEPTPQKYEELVQQLSNLLKVPFTVIRHEAGIRPSTPTRRPLFMRSKRNQNVFTFNGLGTKGVLLAPMLAEEIALFFKNQKQNFSQLCQSFYYKLAYFSTRKKSFEKLTISRQSKSRSSQLNASF